MKLTCVNSVSPRMIRNVVRMDTIAMMMGTSARNDPNTKTRTASAPMPAISVSASTAGPCPELPAEAKGSRPVTRTLQPVGSALLIARVMSGASAASPWNPVPRGANTSPNVTRPSEETNRGSPVLA